MTLNSLEFNNGIIVKDTTSIRFFLNLKKGSLKLTLLLAIRHNWICNKKLNDQRSVILQFLVWNFIQKLLGRIQTI